VELATALGDALRARAQARLAAAAPEAQVAAFVPKADDGGQGARVITRAVGVLLGSGRVDDEPDVERGEAGDGEG
jgi:hypothetical protein